MKTSMTKAVFIDANILVAASSNRAPFHEPAAKLLNELHGSRAPLWISRQVLREVAATLSRLQSWMPGLSPDLLVPQLNRYLKLYKVAEESADSSAHLFQFISDGRASGRQVHDANIVAVMLANRVGRLATLNGKDFARYGEEIQVVGP